MGLSMARLLWSLDGYRHLIHRLRVFTTNRHKVIVGYLTADNYIFNSGHDFAFMLKIKNVIKIETKHKGKAFGE